jgi:hypothetical protein
MPGVPHPIPFRTRPLSPPGPMVLRLKARESRSPPGPHVGSKRTQRAHPKPNPSNTPLPSSATKPQTHHTPAGWSSPVARQAHNLKVTGSNPVPAPKALIRSPPPSERRAASSVTTVNPERPRSGSGVTTTGSGPQRETPSVLLGARACRFSAARRCSARPFLRQRGGVARYVTGVF